MSAGTGSVGAWSGESLPSPTGESVSSRRSGGVTGTVAGSAGSAWGSSQRGEGGSASAEGNAGNGSWKKRVSTACLACKKSKRKVCIFPCLPFKETGKLTKASAPASPPATTAAPSTASASSTNPSTNAGASPPNAPPTN